MLTFWIYKNKSVLLTKLIVMLISDTMENYINKSSIFLTKTSGFYFGTVVVVLDSFPPYTQTR